MLVLHMRDKRYKEARNYILDTDDYTVESLTDDEIINLDNNSVNIEGLMTIPMNEYLDKMVYVVSDIKETNAWVDVFAQILIFDNYCIVNTKRYLKIYYKHELKYTSYEFSTYEIHNLLRMKVNHDTICLILKSHSNTIYKCFTYTDDDRIIDMANPFKLERDMKGSLDIPMVLSHIGRTIKQTSEFNVKTRTNINVELGIYWSYNADFNIVVQNEEGSWVRATDTDKEKTLQILCAPLIQKVKQISTELDCEYMQTPGISSLNYRSSWQENSVVNYISEYFKSCVVNWLLLEERRKIAFKTGIYTIHFDIVTDMVTHSSYLDINYVLFDVTEKHKGRFSLGERYKLC